MNYGSLSNVLVNNQKYNPFKISISKTLPLDKWILKTVWLQSPCFETRTYSMTTKNKCPGCYVKWQFKCLKLLNDMQLYNKIVNKKNCFAVVNWILPIISIKTINEFTKLYRGTNGYRKFDISGSLKLLSPLPPSYRIG